MPPSLSAPKPAQPPNFILAGSHEIVFRSAFFDYIGPADSLAWVCEEL
jgi:hypothetical protein